MTLDDFFFFFLITTLNDLERLFWFTNMLNDFELTNNDGKVVHKLVEVFYLYFFRLSLFKKKKKKQYIIKLGNQSNVNSYKKNLKKKN